MLQETICNDDFGRNTVRQKVDAVHTDEFLRNFRNFLVFWLLAVFVRSCLEESGK